MPTTTVSHYEELTLKSLEKLPVFSAALTRLFSHLSQEWVEYRKVATLIESDVVMASYVLGLANSAAFSCSRSVRSIEHAVSLLGVRRLRNCLLAFSVAKKLNAFPPPKGWSLRQFNRHSLATAILADLYACHVKIDHAEDAFLCGLFHDLGRLLIASALPGEYQEILTLRKEEKLPLSACENRVLGLYQGHLSAAALSTWNFPVHVREAVQEQDILPADGVLELTTLKSILQLADQTANSLGYSLLSLNSALASEIPGPEPVGVDTKSIIEEFEREFETIDAAVTGSSGSK